VYIKIYTGPDLLCSKVFLHFFGYFSFFFIIIIIITALLWRLFQSNLAKGALQYESTYFYFMSSGRLSWLNCQLLLIQDHHITSVEYLAFGSRCRVCRAGSEPVVTEPTVLEVELRGVCECYDVVVEPRVMLVPGQIPQDTVVRRKFKVGHTVLLNVLQLGRAFLSAAYIHAYT